MIKKFLLTVLFSVLLTPFCYADIILHNTTKDTLDVRVEWVNPPDKIIVDPATGRFIDKYIIANGEMNPGKNWKLLWDTEEGEIFIIRWFTGEYNDEKLISEKKVVWAKEMKDVISEPGKDLEIILKGE